MIHALVISRDPLQRERIGGYLAEWQNDTDTCENSVQSFAMLLNAESNKKAYDVALIDQRQLDMDPIQFATSVRAEPSLQDLAMILIGPPCSTQRRKQLLAAGYCAVLDTPIDKTQLFNRLQKATRSRLPVQSPKVVDLTERLEQRRGVLSPKEVLLAETSEFTRRSVSRILDRAGHHVFSVTNGEEALDALEHHHFDLAIVESEMELISGIQVVKLHNFSRPVHQWVPFILLARSRSPILTKQCGNAKGCTILLKPVHREQLLEAVARIVQTDIPGSGHRLLPSKDRGGVVQTTMAHPPALDESVLMHLEQIGAVEDFVERLAGQFTRDGQRLIAQLLQAVDREDFDLYKESAHHLIDNSSYLGAVALFEFTSSAARLSRSEFPGNAVGLTEEICSAFENARTALNEYLRKRSDSATGR
jgi:two-component system sensor histidine kinase RpfC